MSALYNMTAVPPLINLGASSAAVTFRFSGLGTNHYQIFIRFHITQTCPAAKSLTFTI